MNIKTFWKKEIHINELHISANPENKKEVEGLLKQFEDKNIITLINPINDMKVKVEINQIESIETFSNYSIVVLYNEKNHYMIQKRLKDLEYLNKFGIVRISNSVMVNINRIKQFKSSENARLEVETKTNKKYVVSRHYAKKIKEEILCLDI
ncbi:LytTR family DNA-binding domain-containing protein [Peptostreptococcus faecalis]|uniref:LytTR family DNA-binding domain-containing protein n=1 Tax=Peptostreptococcus faecalis TaxID=2045015 RepID=UPI0015E0882A|nr:LytTR family DNA-binding domain-containing protein [Peptostreptococcus faecalis]